MGPNDRYRSRQVLRSLPSLLLFLGFALCVRCSSSGAALEGRVRSVISREPLSDFEITATTRTDIKEEQASANVEVKTKGDGTFRLQNLLPQHKYSLIASNRSCRLQTLEADSPDTNQTRVLPSDLLGFCDATADLPTLLHERITLIEIEKSIDPNSLRGALAKAFPQAAVSLYEGPDLFLIVLSMDPTTHGSNYDSSSISRILAEESRGIRLRALDQLTVNATSLPEIALLEKYRCEKPETLATLYNDLAKEALFRGAKYLVIGVDAPQPHTITVIADVTLMVYSLPSCSVLEERSFRRH